jgi:hypothetical protein
MVRYVKKSVKFYFFIEIYGKKPSIEDRRVFAVRLKGFEAIEEVIMSIRIRCCYKGAASTQAIYIS